MGVAALICWFVTALAGDLLLTPATGLQSLQRPLALIVVNAMERSVS